MTLESKAELLRREERRFAEGHSRDPKAVMFRGKHLHVVGGALCKYEPCSMLPRFAPPTCPQCHGPAWACGYDVDNDICPERERFEADR